MTVSIAIPKETAANEKRVALVPAVAAKLQKLGIELTLEAGAGLAARIPDEAYSAAGVNIVEGDVLGKAQVIFKVQPPTLEEVARIPEGTVLFCFVYAHREPEVVKALRDRNISCFAMELVPRISRAQAMDALSSQAALSGYYGALLAATNLSRILPMMTFAVGSIRPAKVLVMGAGVAGLQAIATARRLGAMVEGYDVRPEVKEQVESLGAKFVDTGVSAAGQGGYARELTDEEKTKAAEVLTKRIQQADAVITTAAIPGRPSPKIVSDEQIAGMKSGSVIIDLAAEGGGNTNLTKPGETATVGQTTIVAPLNIPSLLAEHASELYAKNLLNFIELFVAEGELKLDWEDEIVAKAVLTHAQEVKNEAAQKAIEA